MSIFWAFVSWLQNVPRWAWYVLLAIAGVYWLRADARRDGYQKAENEIINDIEEQTDERIQRARSASDELNARSLEQLREQRASDPNNRGRVS